MIKSLLSLSFIALFLPSFVFAAYDDVTLTTDTVLSVNGQTLNVSGNSATLASIVVNDTNFSVTVQAGSSLTVNAPARNVLGATANDKVTATNVCDNAESTLSLSANGEATITITPSTDICSRSGGGGSGGSSSHTTLQETEEEATNTTSPINGTTFTFTHDLTFNMYGEDVRELQKYLNAHGFTIATVGPGSVGNETDYFGPATRAALIRFQEANSIEPAVGYFGPLTRAAVIHTHTTAPKQETATDNTGGSTSTFMQNLALGDTHPDVKRLQEFLNANNFIIAESGPGSVGNETDFFGTLTKAALIRFQDAHAAEILIPTGLTNGTGYFGPSTRAFVNSL